MNDISTDIQVWFLRHGKTPFDYENSKYDDFMDMLSNGHETPLHADHGIKFETLPDRVELIAHSPARRAADTAELLGKKLSVIQVEELEILREVRFDKDLILPQEYESLARNRKDILERWYSGRNQREKFQDSWERAIKIDAFLRERQEKTMILVTHGWFLRLLQIYIVQGKHHTPTIDELLEVKPVPLGHWIKATLARRPRSVQAGSLGTETTGRGEYYRSPVTSLPNRR